MLVRVPMTRGQDLAVLSFRGTHAFTDWISNLDTLLIDTREGGLVHKGFSEALDRIWPEVALTLRSVGLPIVFTGHSLGGALATIAASRLPGHGRYPCGSPRVGNAAFNQRVESSPWYRVVNGRDLVCQVPPPLPRLGFTHGGTAAYISQEGELRLDPESWQMTLDQLRLEWWTVSSAQRKRLFLELPKFMTDHAPINYVAHLQRLIFAELRS
jgi:triacylglycerol lipase